MLASDSVVWLSGLVGPRPLLRIVTCGTAVILASCGGSKSPPASSTQPATALAAAANPAPADISSEDASQVSVSQADTSQADSTHANAAQVPESTDQGLSSDANISSVDQQAVDGRGSTPLPSTATVTATPAPTAEHLAKWDIRAAEPLKMLACHDWDALGLVATVVPTPVEDYFIVGGSKLTLWKPTAAEPQHVFLDLTGRSQSLITALAVADDGTWFCAGDSTGQLYVWRLADRSQIISKPLYTDDIVDIAISPAGDEIATLTFTAEVTTWDTQRWEKKRSFALDTNSVKRIEYLAAGRLAAAGETTSLWDTATGMLAQQLSPGRYQYTLAATPDREQFVCGTEAGLQFLNAPDLAPARLIEGDFGEALLSFASDQRRMAACIGKDIVIYDVNRPRILQVIEASGPDIAGVVWMPTSRLLVSVTQLGRIRVWGDESAAQASQMQPLHQAVSLATAATPATPAQVSSLVDVRTLPRLPESQINLGSGTFLTYTAPSSVAEAKIFYHYLLGELGWESVPTDPQTPDYLNFVRDGFTLFISLASTPQQLQVSLTLLGNCDMRTLPRLASGEIATVYENDTSVGYTTTSDLLTIETELLRLMRQAGWTHFCRLNSSHAEEPDVRDLEFYKGAINVRISVRKFPHTPDRYTVQNSKFLGLSSLPVPADVSMVEADLISGEARLVANTVLPLAATREFYVSEMQAQGWLLRSPNTSTKEDRDWLNFIRDQHEVTIDLTATDQRHTLIRVGEGLENLSWQLKRPQPIAQDAAATDAAPPLGIEAADFPLAPDATSIEFNAERKELNFKIESAQLMDVADHYLAELAKLGWQPTREGIKSADYVFLTFGKGNADKADKAEINLRARSVEQAASVGIEGDGLLWNKPLPMPPQRVSYATWLRRHQHPASLDLLETYETEMRQLTAAPQN